MTWGWLFTNLICRGSPKEKRNIRAALLIKINCHQKTNKERENIKLEIFSLSSDVCVIGEAISRGLYGTPRLGDLNTETRYHRNYKINVCKFTSFSSF